MLSCYATVDERCRILGYVMKAFVKLCHVGDASRGSLSSYAYTLMVIFFLQQRNPPVLPVLQQVIEIPLSYGLTVTSRHFRWQCNAWLIIIRY